MNTLHYNGAIVTHPDNSDSFNKRIVANLKKGKCVYGKSCLHCPVFLDNERAKQRVTGPKKIFPIDCQMRRSPDCPHNKEAREYGLQNKTYCITNKIRNQISDRGAWMYHNAKNKLLFATLTVPPFKVQLSNGDKEKLLNEAFSRFIENARKHYGLCHYLAVREGDGVRKRYHYHVIMDIPFVDFMAINNAWVHTLAGICNYSRNAFTTDKKARTIRSISSATRYIAKYISKAGRERHPTRVFFCDRETANAVVTTEFYDEISAVREQFPIEGYKYNDFVIRYTIRDRILSDKFFREVVTAMFSAYKKREKEPEFIIFSDT